MSSVDLRYSKDGGRNWSDWRRLPMGQTGDFVKRIETRRFGRGRQWLFEVRITDPVRADIMSASIQAEGAET